jgi:hypothetical protein
MRTYHVAVLAALHIITFIAVMLATGTLALLDAGFVLFPCEVVCEVVRLSYIHQVMPEIARVGRKYFICRDGWWKQVPLNQDIERRQVRRATICEVAICAKEWALT